MAQRKRKENRWQMPAPFLSIWPFNVNQNELCWVYESAYHHSFDGAVQQYSVTFFLANLWEKIMADFSGQVVSPEDRAAGRGCCAHTAGRLWCLTPARMSALLCLCACKKNIAQNISECCEGFRLITPPYVAILHNQPPCQAWIYYTSHIPFIETKSNRCMHHRPSQGILCIGPVTTRNQDFGYGQNYTRHHLFTKHSRDCVPSSLTCIQNSPEEWPCPRLHVALTSWEKPWLLWMTILRRYVLTSKNSYSAVKMSFSAHAWAPGNRNQSDHTNSQNVIGEKKKSQWNWAFSTESAWK